MEVTNSEFTQWNISNYKFIGMNLCTEGNVPLMVSPNHFGEPPATVRLISWLCNVHMAKILSVGYLPIQQIQSNILTAFI